MEMRRGEFRHSNECGPTGFCANHMSDFPPTSTSIQCIRTLGTRSNNRISGDFAPVGHLRNESGAERSESPEARGIIRICRNVARFQPTTQRHDTALWHFLRRYNCGFIAGKFELKGPTTQDASTTDHGRLELPKLRGLQSHSREIFARTARFEHCVLHVS